MSIILPKNKVKDEVEKSKDNALRLTFKKLRRIIWKRDIGSNTHNSYINYN